MSGLAPVGSTRDELERPRRLGGDHVLEVGVRLEDELLLRGNRVAARRRQAVRPARQEDVVAAVLLEARVAAVGLVREARREDHQVAVKQVEALGAREVGFARVGIDVLDLEPREEVLANRDRLREAEANLAVARDVVLPAFEELDQLESSAGT